MTVNVNNIGSVGANTQTLAQEIRQAARKKHDGIMDHVKKNISDRIRRDPTSKRLVVDVAKIIGHKFSVGSTVDLTNDVKDWVRAEGFTIEGDVDVSSLYRDADFAVRTRRLTTGISANRNEFVIVWDY